VKLDFLQRSLKWIATAILILASTAVSNGSEELQRFRNSNVGTRFVWFAHHESGNFSEYFWRHAYTTCGWLVAVPDPTSSGRGYVSESQIYCALGKGKVHRLYPTLNLEQCLYGSYYSSFNVWLSAPPAEKRGWISLATYTNVKNWKDLFAVNLGTEAGQTVLVLFHVPKFGQSRFQRRERISFPMKQWVRIEVVVDAQGVIYVFQDGAPVLRATKDWGPAGPSICEAHWGLYADGNTDFAHLLNDDIVLRSNGYPN
jgi:hypothetical protein